MSIGKAVELVESQRQLRSRLGRSCPGSIATINTTNLSMKLASSSRPSKLWNKWASTKSYRMMRRQCKTLASDPMPIIPRNLATRDVAAIIQAIECLKSSLTLKVRHLQVLVVRVVRSKLMPLVLLLNRNLLKLRRRMLSNNFQKKRRRKMCSALTLKFLTNFRSSSRKR